MNAIKFGLIGHPLGHSLSPLIHAELLAAAGLPGTYDLYDIDPAAWDDTAPALLHELKGLNCTIPYKEKIIPLLDRLNPEAAAIGAVNTVSGGCGYNTDTRGFLEDCPSLTGQRVLILGAGGVSRTMAFAAASAGARQICLLVRQPTRAEKLIAAVQVTYPACRLAIAADPSGLPDDCPAPPSGSADPSASSEPSEPSEPSGPGQAADCSVTDRRWILLNGTPVGMWPQTGGLPIPVSLLKQVSYVYDTIYNPVATRLVLAARSRGIPARNGLGMLFNQGLAAQQIWHPTATFPAAACRRIRARMADAVLRRFPLTLVLIGFMGSGKSTIGRSLAQALNLPLIDLDEVIVQSVGRSIPAIFQDQGEAGFRRIERETLAHCLAGGQAQVLAAGGGTLVSPEAEAILRHSPALVILLDCSLETALRRVGSGKDRPMLGGRDADSVRELFESRLPRYVQLADLRVDANREPSAVTAAILAGLGFEGEST